MNPRESITRTFFKGLAVVLPVAILLASVVWLARAADATLIAFFQPFLPTQYHLPGVGLLMAVILCYLAGLLMNTTLAPRIIAAWHRVLERIPLIKSLYGAVEDILDSFSKNKERRFNRVVKVHFADLNIWVVGFVTREDLSGLPDGLNNAAEMAVYLPMSYQIGGYLVIVPKSAVHPLDLSVEDASRFVLTAGMSIRKAPPHDDVPVKK
jgi:uncharacterized membrane protein